MMQANVNQGSAKIYQFPVGGRAALGRGDGAAKPALDNNAPRVNETICSGSWYHEEAIREASPKWER
jgi:Protein of unknown function (DUF2735)